MENIISQFSQARDEFIKAINAFPIIRRTEILFGKWNLQQVVEHFCGWDKYFTRVLTEFGQGEKPEFWNKINEFNEREINKRKGFSWDDTYQEFLQAGENFINVCKNINKNLINKAIWLDKKYTPLKLLQINIRHYQKAQLQEIKKLLRKWLIKV